jgi:hypothetical protein
MPKTGSEEHKYLFCQTFVDTHDAYDPARIEWPDLDDETLARLSGLPVWNEAVSTERETALKVQALADVETDPVLREAIALQGYEEARHSRLLDLMTAHYGIAVERGPEARLPSNPEWEFMRTGYGECFDSFFAFGLISFAADSGFFPPALVALFDPIMQEEARHILFFANWVAYRRRHVGVAGQPAYAFRRGLAISLQVLSRIRTAIDVGKGNDQENFAMKSHESFGEISARRFLETCLRENRRRLSHYDERLLRPRLVPPLARFALHFLPRSPGEASRAGGPTS